ncbi:MAG: ATP-binding protein [Smithella sp.]|jgi:two-component system sensor histidine kinase HydH
MVLKAKKRIWFNISVWIVMGAIAVVAIVSAVMTFAHFQRQKEQAVEFMVEKGATLIRSFEAGLRSPLSMKTGNFGLQKLLMETAQQPDIDYIIVTDSKGNILADSDPAQLGYKYGLDLEIDPSALSRDIKWRQVVNTGGAGTFEVYSVFFPQERPSMEVKPAERTSGDQKTGRLIIYVGMNMAAIEKAGKEDTRNTIIIALVLLLVGSSIIVSLFLMQAYRLEHTSLSRMTIFSEALVKNMPIGLIALDDQGLIITCNENAQAVLSVACSEASGKSVADLLPAPLQKILTQLPPRGGLLEQDIQLTSAEREEQTWEIVATGLMDEGKPAGKILLIRNVTQTRLLEKEVAKSRHLNSIGSLAAGVAHEIRNPLSSIKGFAVYFKERLSGNKDDQQTADVMIQEVERLNRVISQLIEFARPLELKKEKVQFDELVQHAVKLIAADAQKNKISVEVEADKEIPPVEVDSDKIKQVLLNIFLNALSALPDGGRLKIKLSFRANNLEVIISDNGAGIEKMNLPRIYDPYFTSKPAGTGLGLAVVQKIMEAHGGHINVESVAGKGTEVFLIFPLSAKNQTKSNTEVQRDGKDECSKTYC